MTQPRRKTMPQPLGLENHPMFTSEKRCTRCSTTKAITEFYVNNSFKDGRAKVCADCVREEQSVSRAKKQAQNDVFATDLCNAFLRKPAVVRHVQKL